MGIVPLMPRAGDWTVDDLARLPDDGLQYELADGILLVTPAPRAAHQVVVVALTVRLAAAVTEGWRLLVAPFDYQPNARRRLQPDVLVAREEDLTETNIGRPLLLAVEVLSPSTRAKDLVLKRALYADSGVASYWLVDPAVPSVVVLELVGDEYVEAQHAVGDQTIEVARPFPVSLTPSELIR